MKAVADMRVTLVANAGVLVQGGGENLLVDALYRRGPEKGFSPPSAQMQKALLAGHPPFDGPAHLLFTHHHPDHFSIGLTAEYLKTRGAKGLVLPGGAAAAHPELMDVAKGNAEKIVILDNPEGFSRVMHLGEATLTAFRVPHAGREFVDTEHYAFLLEAGGRTLLAVADSNYLPELFVGMLAGRSVDAALVNPLFLNKSRGRRTITEGIAPGRLLVYHLPFEGEDPMGYRKVAAYDREKHAGQLPPTQLMLRENQSVTI